MKKYVLFAAVIAAVSLSSCKKAAVEEAPVLTEEEVTVVEETPVVVEGDSIVLGTEAEPVTAE